MVTEGIYVLREREKKKQNYDLKFFLTMFYILIKYFKNQIFYLQVLYIIEVLTSQQDNCLICFPQFFYKKIPIGYEGDYFIW